MSKSKRTQGKPMHVGGYTNTESQYGVCNKYVLSPEKVKTNPITLDESLPEKRKQS